MKENKRIIAIVGLMGVGKSTIGFRLSEKLGFYFIDSDQEIEDREKSSITKIFNDKGEKYFREVEENLIKEIVARNENIVLSLGGGAFINDEVRKVLKEKAVTIWLYASASEIIRRVGNKTSRPLLNQGNKRQILDELIEKRYPSYLEADFKFDTEKEGQETLINKIAKIIKAESELDVKNKNKNKNKNNN